MGLRHKTPSLFSIRSSTILTITLFLASSTIYFFALAREWHYPGHLARAVPAPFGGDLCDARFPWNKLSYGPASLEKLKLAVFSKSWPVGPGPGGMERHAYTLYGALAARSHEIHIFTVPSDKKLHGDLIRNGSLRLHFAANDPARSANAGEVLLNIYNLPPRNVHVILNSVDDKKFVHDPKSSAEFRRQHGIPDNVTVVMGTAGRLVRDKGHPLLHQAFSEISKRQPNVLLLVAGSGPWGKRYEELGPTVKILGPLEANELSAFYNAIDVFVNPTLRPQGLDC
ncbi:hypothetical protein RHGRI_018357 [Rhododendron griersonianum]|uniref:Glycosyltransferase subfamily 4-like N-terminal domain-containing protein n=1 Tax=Rhododendron griersonianum TaxID=479676 RepID=A0AAV6K193_9ERIC|nr:hypothetical protein RHGRI_018357 [Rhododendron griersonianum]